VIDSGTRVEPIAYVENGKLVDAITGDSDPVPLKAFSNTYYKAGTEYDLIFAGVKSGKVKVDSSDPSSDCGKNIATVTTSTTGPKMSTWIMGLATNAEAKTEAGVRRAPSAEEKAEMEKLVRAAFTKNKVPATATKTLRYHNLTVLDVDNDGKPEIVGSYYASVGKTARYLLFFIAEQNAEGKYVFGHSHYTKYTQKDMMDGAALTALDTGVYHELLLDSFDYAGDGKGAIFTMESGLEAAGFNVYRKQANGKWLKVLERTNYHCGF